MMPCMMFSPSCAPYGYMPARAYYAPRSACGPCGFSPCANPLWFLGALLFLPTILKLIFFGVGLVLNVTPLILMVALTYSLVNDCESRTWCHQAKTTASAEKKVDDNKHEQEEPALVHEDTTARVKVDNDKCHVVLAVPGIRRSDLKVRVIDDRILRVSGETKAGSDVYRVARDIQLPSINMQTLTATHEDGVLSIVVKRKIRDITIPVTSSSSAAEVTTASSSTPAPAAKEEEWEPLPAAQGPAAKAD